MHLPFAAWFPWQVIRVTGRDRVEALTPTWRLPEIKAFRRLLNFCIENSKFKFHHTWNSAGNHSENKGMTKSKIRWRKAIFLESTPAVRGPTVAAPSGGFQNLPAVAWPCFPGFSIMNQSVFFWLFHYESSHLPPVSLMHHSRSFLFWWAIERFKGTVLHWELSPTKGVIGWNIKSNL